MTGSRRAPPAWSKAYSGSNKPMVRGIARARRRRRSTPATRRPAAVAGAAPRRPPWSRRTRARLGAPRHRGRRFGIARGGAFEAGGGEVGGRRSDHRVGEAIGGGGRCSSGSGRLDGIRPASCVEDELDGDPRLPRHQAAGRGHCSAPPEASARRTAAGTDWRCDGAPPARSRRRRRRSRRRRRCARGRGSRRRRARPRWRRRSRARVRVDGEGGKRREVAAAAPRRRAPTAASSTASEKPWRTPLACRSPARGPLTSSAPPSTSTIRRQSHAPARRRYAAALHLGDKVRACGLRRTQNLPQRYGSGRAPRRRRRARSACPPGAPGRRGGLMRLPRLDRDVPQRPLQRVVRLGLGLVRRDVGRDALLVDVGTSRREVDGGGELERRGPFPSSTKLWTRPLPNVLVPMTGWRMRGPLERAGDDLRGAGRSPLTSTTIGSSVATGPVAANSSRGACRPSVDVTSRSWNTPVTSTACSSRPPPL